MTRAARGAAKRGARARLDRSFAYGTAWTVAMKAVGQTAAWLSTLVVARLLDPSDYGIFGMATLYLGLLQLLSEFGIGTAIVAQERVDLDDARQLNTVAVGIGTVGAALLCATSPLVAWFFKTPRLMPVLVALSFSFVVSSFRTVPWALLQRDLRFKRLAFYDALQAIGLAACSITLAASGAGYWTLVVSALLSAFLSTALTVYHHPIGFARPVSRSVRGTLSLGGDVVVQRLSWYGYSNADFLVAGRVLGQRALGGYALAWSLANLAIDKIAATILQVTPGVLSQVQRDTVELRRYVLRITELMTLALTPVSIGFALVAPEFVHGVLGPSWQSIIRTLQVLCLYATVRGMMPLFSQVLLMQGEQRVATRANLFLVCVMPPVFWFGSRWGTVGMALGWMFVYPIVAWLIMRRALHSVGLKGRTFAREALWPALSACAVMALAVTGVRAALPQSWPALARLALESISGGVVYVAILLLLHRARMRALLTAFRTLRATAASPAGTSAPAVVRP